MTIHVFIEKNTLLMMIERISFYFKFISLSIKGVLLANKVDLDGRRKVSEKVGKDFAESNGLEYFECSAVSQYYISVVNVKKYTAGGLVNGCLFQLQSCV